MRVGFVGLGKLGLPVAYAMAAQGLEVFGHDPAVKGPPDDMSHESGLAATVGIGKDRLRFASLSDVVEKADVIFIAVQTPHGPEFEGVTPLTDERADFDYSHLKQAVAAIDHHAFTIGKDVTLAIISTVLPGTIRREIEPLTSRYTSLAYNPSFIAMGTTVRDFLDPEFVLIGGDTDNRVWSVYQTLGIGPIRRLALEDAEVVKVAYNTFIGLKIVFANTLMELCHKTDGADVDEVTDTLAMAKRRLISPAYMSGGMGDGGACHPRDNIALSWLARGLNLSHDLFEDVMNAREDQARFLVRLMKLNGNGLPYGILGMAYKADSEITTGSAARLCLALLDERGHDVTVMFPGASLPAEPHVWLVGAQHTEWHELDFPKGTVIIDPWRYMLEREGVEIVPVGIGAVADDRKVADGAALSSIAA